MVSVYADQPLAFSDFPWPAESKPFPIRSEVSGYLRAYAKTFDLLKYIRFGVQVTSVQAIDPEAWRIDTMQDGQVETDVFSHVIIATGFFSRPYVPNFPGLDQFRGEIRHARECDSAATIRAALSGKRVLVVGAAFSGTEIAGQIAPYAASTLVSLRRPMWFIPRFISLRPDGPRYPYDLVFYDRSPRNRLLRQPHRFLAEIGGDPGTASPELAFDSGQELPTDLVITDDFLSLVRDERVRVKRSASLCFDKKGVTFADGSRTELDAVVMCTGYKTALPLFDASTLKTLEFDGNDRLQPLLLHRQVFHPALPNLAFVGCYRGAYFPIMDLQSRWIAGILAGDLPAPSLETMRDGIEDERRIRFATPRPQFPHGDLVGLADGLAREAKVLPALPSDHPLHSYTTSGPVLAAHFRLCGPHAKPVLAEAIIRATPAPRIDPDEDAHPLEPTSSTNASVAELAFRTLEGCWSVSRSIEPGGHFVGTAAFTVMSDGRMLYDEMGTLRLLDGRELDAANRYIYALRGDAIEIVFADGANANAHFMNLAFPTGQSTELPLESTGRHQCRLDNYDAVFRMEHANGYNLTYVVSGPRKDYVIRTVYRRMGHSGLAPHDVSSSNYQDIPKSISQAEHVVL